MCEISHPIFESGHTIHAMPSALDTADFLAAVTVQYGTLSPEQFAAFFLE